jgi:hypothetical protein
MHTRPPFPAYLRCTVQGQHPSATDSCRTQDSSGQPMHARPHSAAYLRCRHSPGSPWPPRTDHHNIVQFGRMHALLAAVWNGPLRIPMQRLCKADSDRSARGAHAHAGFKFTVDQNPTTFGRSSSPQAAALSLSVPVSAVLHTMDQNYDIPDRRTSPTSWCGGHYRTKLERTCR